MKGIKIDPKKIVGVCKKTKEQFSLHGAYFFYDDDHNETLGKVAWQTIEETDCGELIVQASDIQSKDCDWYLITGDGK